jgi:diguanylate cyclase (GGDEF)-like protein
MPQLINLIIIGPVIVGAVILISSIFPVRKLILQLPLGAMRRNWYVLNGLIIFFIIGYVSYALVLGNHEISLADFVVSMIFFLGACFVWLVNVLSLKTALDVRRISLLEHENITDGLIDIYNRRYFDRRVEEEFQRAHRYGLPLSILLLDIDHFKRVNDTYGHQAGDSVLKNIGKVLVATVRNTDIVARYGGEEICIIATNTVQALAVELAERLRLLLEASEMVPADEKTGQPPIRITVSIGVSALHSGIDSAKELLKSADTALYHAKSRGRNQVASAEVSPVNGDTSPIMPVSQFEEMRESNVISGTI